MKQGAFLLVTSSIFALIALLHVLRLFYGWKVDRTGLGQLDRSSHCGISRLSRLPLEGQRAMTRKPIALILALILAVLAAPLAAEGQQVGKVYRIGYLSIASGPSPRTEALRQGLRELGYIEGKNITIEYRFAQEKADRLRGLATELVNLKVDLIVAGGPTATRAAQQATRTLPVVMAWG